MTHKNSLKSTLQSKMTQYESDLKQVSEVIKIHDFIGAAEDVTFLHNQEQDSIHQSEDADKLIVREMYQTKILQFLIAYKNAMPDSV